MTKLSNSALSAMILIITSFFVAKFAMSEDYVVKMVRGHVTILPPGHHDATEVYEGMSVKEDSSIVTGDKSFVRIMDYTGSLINIGPSSKAVIKTLQTPENPGVILLLKGAIRNKISKDSKAIKQIVRTKNVSLGVRGTEFALSYNPANSASSLIMYEGTVSVEPVSTHEYEMKSSDDAEIKAVLERTNLKVSEGQFYGVKDETPSEIVKISESQLEHLKAKTDFENPETKNIHIQKDEMVADIENGTVLSGEVLLNNPEKKRELNITDIKKEEARWEFRFGVKPFFSDIESRQSDNGQTFSTRATGLGVKTGFRTFKDDLSVGFNINVVQSQNDIKKCSDCNIRTKREGEKQTLLGTNLYLSKDLSPVSTGELNFETEERDTVTTLAKAKKEKIAKVEAVYSRLLLGDREKSVSGNASIGAGTMSRYGEGMILGLGISSTFDNNESPITVYGGINSEIYGDTKAKYESQKINIGVGFEF